MINNTISFISEHTAELMLVPILADILKKEFDFVIPIFPWATREGSRLSLKIHHDDQFKILGLYPRRPKVNLIKRDFVNIKINEEIIKAAHTGSEFGIPIIAGCPLAFNFWELGQPCNCIWFKLQLPSEECRNFKINRSELMAFKVKMAQSIFNNDTEILELVKNNAQSYNINRAMRSFKEIKMNSQVLQAYSLLSFIGGYKPVYFLLK